jgi:hypothetical protein
MDWLEHKVAEENLGEKEHLEKIVLAVLPSLLTIFQKDCRWEVAVENAFLVAEMVTVRNKLGHLDDYEAE